MKLFCAQRSKTPPYHTTNIVMVYDVFDNSIDGTYFITYSTPVVNATPMYTWVNKSGAFSDFSTSSPPSHVDTPSLLGHHGEDISTIENSKLWDSSTINPIYVMHPTIVGDDYTKIKFMCNNGTCLVRPSDDWIAKSRKAKAVGWTGPDIYNPYNMHEKPVSLDKCVINCNELVKWEDGGGSPLNLINIIQRSQESLNSTTPSHKTLTLYIGIKGVVIFLFIIVVVILLYILL